MLPHHRNLNQDTAPPPLPCPSSWLIVVRPGPSNTNIQPSTPAPAPSAPTWTEHRSKPRRNDFDAVLDPSQTAAQGGQIIRMRVLPQATYMPAGAAFGDYV